MSFGFVARRAGFATALLALSMLAVARADDAPAPEQPAAAPAGQKSAGARAATPAPPAAAEQHRLPPDSTTKQTLALPGRTLAFAATAGSVRLFDDKGEPQADIAYTSYQLDGADPATRPVTFFFNGGPGAASAYLQLGAVGPWRLSIDGDAAIPSASPDLAPNAETWLDFTDLVFIDPVGTGYSRFVATGDDVRKRFFSVDGDVNSIALSIRRWLEKSGRLLLRKGAKRRSNPFFSLCCGLDCFASLAMTISTQLRFGRLKFESVEQPGCHHPRKRVIKYAVAFRLYR